MPPRRKGADMKVSASTVMLAGLKPGTYVSETSEAKSKEEGHRGVRSSEPTLRMCSGTKAGAPSRSIEP